MAVCNEAYNHPKGIPLKTTATTEKGEKATPPVVRKKIARKPQERTDLSQVGQSEFVSKARTGSIMDLEGSIRWTGKSVTIEEMNETIAKGWAGLLTFED